MRAFLLGGDLHSLADSLPVLAICVGLAFLPAAGEENVYRARPPWLLRQVGVVVVMALFLAGSSWSYLNYETATGSAAASPISPPHGWHRGRASRRGDRGHAGPVVRRGRLFWALRLYRARGRRPRAAVCPAELADGPGRHRSNLKIFDSRDGCGDQRHPRGDGAPACRPARLLAGGVTGRGDSAARRLWDWAWTMSSSIAARRRHSRSGSPRAMHYSAPAGRTCWIPATGAGVWFRETARRRPGGLRQLHDHRDPGRILASQPSPAAPVRG